MKLKLKAALAGLAPYAAGKPVDEVKRELGLSRVVKLASNENPYGLSDAARTAIINAAAGSNIYPDGAAYSLRGALADRLGVGGDELIFGTGSDGLIELLAKTFLSAGDEAIMPDPSFALYNSNTLAAGAVPVKVPLRADYKMDLDAMADRITDRTRIIWLCHPNNPTGEISGGAELLRFLEAVPEDVLVVSDEAYYEFASGRDGYFESLASRRENLITLRTFSKLHGLAGLRVGYGIADAAVISELEKVRSPFNVNSLAQAAAAASLTDAAFAAMTLEKNAENMKYLCGRLDEMGLYHIPSYTNFIAVNVGMDSQKAFSALLSRGYIVKGGHVLGMNGFLRVTVGTREECEGFINALSEVISENEKSQ